MHRCIWDSRCRSPRLRDWLPGLPELIWDSIILTELELRLQGLLGGGLEDRLGVCDRPVENAHIESFNGRLREECSSQHWFRDLAEAGRFRR